jgi:tetratricopeptide (TPR) repeat protein
LTVDPTYAPAYAGLADSYNLLGYIGDEPRQASFRQAREAASRALALDGSLAEAHASLGLVLMLADWDLAGAERALRRAIELNPSYSSAHQWLAQSLFIENPLDKEAELHLSIARQLNPYSPIIAILLSEHAFELGNPDRALELARQAVELEPGFGSTHEQLWSTLHAKGRWAEAIKELEQTLSLSGYSEAARRAGDTYATSGYRAALLAVCDYLEKLHPEKGDTGWPFPQLAALGGDRERAIASLEKAFARREPFVLFLRQTIAFNSLHGDPRFETLVRRLRTRKTQAADTPSTIS